MSSLSIRAAYNRIIQILTGCILRVAAGIPRIADFYREPSIDTSDLSCHGGGGGGGGGYIAEDVLFHSCSGRSRSFLCECSRCRSDFMNVGRLPNRRANMTCTILCIPVTPRPHFPIFRSLDRIFCLLVDLGEFVCTLPVLVVGKMYREHAPRNMAGLYTLKQGRNLHMSIYSRFIVLSVTI